ncbi:MAG: phosphatidylglycerol lysyltransferase domain-containing protein [Paracoccaceae bacterium]|mgnify:CR=1 FL=1
MRNRVFLGCGQTLRFAVPFAVVTVCLYLIGERFDFALLASIPDRLGSIPLWALLLSLALTAISFWAVGKNEQVAHTYLQTGISGRHAWLSGCFSVSLSQILGFGAVTGAIARWRILPSLTATQAAFVSCAVCVFFLSSFAVVAALACLFLPAPGWTLPVALSVLLCAQIGLIALFFFPALNARGRVFQLPSIHLAFRCLLWTCLDVTAAALAFFVLLPAGTELGFAAFFPLFCIALGSALLSNAPGGVGPFELLLMIALPQVPAADLLASVIAFRLIYYALPACIGVVALLRPFSVEAAGLRPLRERPNITSGKRSEIGVIRQNGGTAIHLLDGAAAVWPTGQTVTALGDPIHGSTFYLMHGLPHLGRRHGRIPLVYKCSARIAAYLRYGGWSVLHIADDAIIDLNDFSLETPKRRTLRRKIRKAERAGLEVDVPHMRPWADLERIDSRWQQINGPAKGGTMGRYSPAYVDQQWIATASIDGKVVAFVTFHIGQYEWCLDLMRSDADAPDGTMHALVEAGIRSARAAGAQEVCLAATQACPDPNSAFWRWASFKLAHYIKADGLRQFKSSFGPTWRPRYAAAPNSAQLVIGLCDVAKEVLRPPELDMQIPSLAHNFDEDNELDSIRRA